MKDWKYRITVEEIPERARGKFQTFPELHEGIPLNERIKLSRCFDENGLELPMFNQYGTLWVRLPERDSVVLSFVEGIPIEQPLKEWWPDIMPGVTYHKFIEA